MIEITQAAKALRSLGAEVAFTDGADLVVDGYAVELKSFSRKPTPSILKEVLRNLRADKLLVAVDSVTPAVRELTRVDPRLVILTPDEVIIDGSSRHAEPQRVQQRTSRGPLPYARFAIGRTLLSRSAPWRQVELARAAGVTQGAVSNALRAWPELIKSGRAGVRVVEPSVLFDHLVEHQPSGGVVAHWWSDRDLAVQAEDVAAAGSLLSGDLAASRIRGWRRPEHVVAYATKTVDLSKLGYVMADASDYTAKLVVPDDPTIWATAATFGYETADPILVATDILRTATWGDQDEAVAVLKAVVMEQDL